MQALCSLMLRFQKVKRRSKCNTSKKFKEVKSKSGWERPGRWSACWAPFEVTEWASQRHTRRNSCKTCQVSRRLARRGKTPSSAANPPTPAKCARQECRAVQRSWTVAQSLSRLGKEDDCELFQRKLHLLTTCLHLGRRFSLPAEFQGLCTRESLPRVSKIWVALWNYEPAQNLLFSTGFHLSLRVSYSVSSPCELFSCCGNMQDPTVARRESF